MAEPRTGDSSSAVASVAIVVLVIVAIIAGYFLFFRGQPADPAPNADIEVEINGLDRQ